jgi:hypothetical protein
MGMASMVAFFVFLPAQLVSVSLQSNLAMDLRDAHPQAHRSAGSPHPRQFTRHGGWNLPWLRYVLLRRFARDPLAPPALRGMFEVVFWLGWIRLLALAVFLGIGLWQAVHFAIRGIFDA